MTDWPEFAEMTAAQRAEIKANVAQIRRLCRMVQTPEQFDAIMAQVPDDEHRAHIRALCEPLLPWFTRPS